MWKGNLEAMALNYPSCSLLMNDECFAMMRGCGCWSEEASPLSSIGVNALFRDDLESERDDESDPVDLLPTDPFGMNFETTLTAALASYFGDLTGAGRFGNGDGVAVCADLSYYFLNHALALSREPLIGGHSSAFEGPLGFGGLAAGGDTEHSPGLPPRASCSQSIGYEEDPCASGIAALACCDAVPVQEGTAPHDGMLFALGYLGLRDILSVEMVCKSLHSAVRNDPLLWKCIHVEQALCKISDPDLLRLTQKFPGALQCLNINNCLNITDKGLNAVLESNPGLTKLSIAHCERLTLDGLISNLKSFSMKAVYGIKSLRFGTRFNLPKKQYEELLSLLSIDKMQELHNQEPRFCQANHLLSDCSDGYALDIEMCPICQSYKLVYDCPEEECNARRSGNCRACGICIKRCGQCGRCLEPGIQFEEKFDLVYRCYKCLGDPASSLTGEK